MKKVKLIIKVTIIVILIFARLYYVGELMIISEENKYQYIALPHEYIGSATGTQRYKEGSEQDARVLGIRRDTGVITEYDGQGEYYW